MKTHLKPVILIIILGFVLYASSLNNPFLWDDGIHIESCDFIKDLGNLPKLFSKDYFDLSGESRGISYRPITTLSYFISYRLWKLNPLGYHISSLLNHIFNAILIYLLAYFLFQNKKVALLSGLFFTSHPMHFETVSCISCNENLLVCMFLLLSFYLYVKIRKRKEKHEKNILFLKVLSNIFYLFALFSKEVAITLPLILVFYDWCFIPKQKRGKFVERIIYSYSGYIAITIFYLLVRFFLLQDIWEVIFNHSLQKNPLAMDILKMVTFIFYYIKLLIFPIFYFPQIPKSLFEPLFLVIIGGNTLICLLGVGLYRYSKKAFWCFSWIFLNLFPVIILIPFRYLFAERYLYVSSIGFCMLLAISIGYGFVVLKSHLMKSLLKIVLIFILTSYSVIVIKENVNSKDDILRDLRFCGRYPYNDGLRFNLAWDYHCEGLYDEAIREYKKTLQLNPYFTLARINLGNIYREKGWHGLAISEYRKALRLSPDDAGVHNNLGICYSKKKLYNMAMKEYKEAIRINPEFTAPYENLGTLYALKGLYDQAIENYRKALTLSPNLIKVRINLGYIYSLERKYNLAVGEYEEALKIDPGNTFAQVELEKLKKLK